VLEAEKMQEAEKPVDPIDVQVISSNVELIQHVYNILERCVVSCRRAKRPQIIVGLSGGSLIKTLADVLPSLNEDYWKAVRFVFCDERRVPFDDPESTYGEYMRVVFPRLQPNVSRDQFIGIDPSLPLEECAADYERKLRALMKPEDEWPEFDVVLLGMGPDGHTCSLFPGHPVLQEQRRWVAAVHDSPKPPPERVTLTLPALNNTSRIAFVATGAAKADMIKQILEGSEEEKARLPAAMIKPVRRRAKIHWFLDKESASKLSNIKK